MMSLFYNKFSFFLLLFVLAFGFHFATPTTSPVQDSHPLTVEFIGDNQEDVELAGADPEIDGRFNRIYDISGISFSADFDRYSDERYHFEFRSRPVFRRQIGDEQWYIWPRTNGYYYISQTDNTDKWFREADMGIMVGVTNNPVDVVNWNMSTAAAGSDSPVLVETADVTNYISHEKVTYSILFNQEVTTFEVADIVIINGMDEDITDGWTIDALAKDTDNPELWTVDITPPPDMDTTAIRLQILGGRVIARDEDGEEHILDEYTQRDSSQRFNTMALNTNQPIASQLYYNNPVQTRLHISSDEPVDRVRIFSIGGRKVFEQSFKTNNPSIDIADLVVGIYILEVRTETGVNRVKLLKE